MNILQINTLDNKGGAAKVAYSLKNEYEKRGIKTSMFVARKYTNDPNVFYVKKPFRLGDRIRKKASYLLANDLDLFKSDQILKTKEFKEADIIHCHNLHSNYFNLGTLEKMSHLKPVVWTFHDMWPITAHCAHAFEGKIKESGFFTCPSLDIYPPIAWHNEKYLEKIKAQIYKNSNFHIVTPSQWLADKTAQSILKDKPISVIYNGIDTSVFRPHDKQECRQSLSLPLDKQIILVVAKGGQLNPWKGGDLAQDIIKEFGDDPRAFFVDLGGDASQDNPNTKSVDYIADQDILAKYYSAADILLYPSIADNCPLVVLEAQACGLPVVTFRTGGIPEIIEHQKTGFIADYKDMGDLITGIRFILDMPPHKQNNMRQSAISRIRENFSLDQMVNQYLNLYQNIINSH